MTPALSKHKVLDLTQVMADMGADVVKLELVGTGE